MHMCFCILSFCHFPAKISLKYIRDGKIMEVWGWRSGLFDSNWGDADTPAFGMHCVLFGGCEYSHCDLFPVINLTSLKTEFEKQKQKQTKLVFVSQLADLA